MHWPRSVLLLMNVGVCFKVTITSWISVTKKSNHYMLPVMIAVRNNRLEATYTQAAKPVDYR